MVIKKPSTRTQGFSWPTITIDRSKTTDHNFVTARYFSENWELHSKVYFTLKHFCYLKLTTHFMCSRMLTNKKQKKFSKKQKEFRDGLSYSTPPKSEETRGNAITQLRSQPIPKFYIFLMG